MLLILKLLPFLIFILLVHQKVISVKTVLITFIATTIAQSFLGILQYINQSSIGLTLLGEVQFDNQTFGIAKIDYNQQKFIRSYGTYLHPNIFAAILVFAIAMIISKFRNDPSFYSGIIIPLIIALILTFSRTSWLALGVIILIQYNLQTQKLKIPLMKIILILSIILLTIVTLDLDSLIYQRLSFFNDAAYHERVTFIEAGIQMIKSNPFGYGANLFTEILPQFTNQHLQPWELQPIHNFWLLLATELGILFPFTLGLILIYCLIKFYKTQIISKTKHQKVIDPKTTLALVSGCILISFFDHYFYTSSQGFLMLSILIILISSPQNQQTLLQSP